MHAALQAYIISSIPKDHSLRALCSHLLVLPCYSSSALSKRSDQLNDLSVMTAASSMYGLSQYYCYAMWVTGIGISKDQVMHHWSHALRSDADAVKLPEGGIGCLHQTGVVLASENRVASIHSISTSLCLYMVRIRQTIVDDELVYLSISVAYC